MINANTVILDLNEYNRLRDIEAAVENGKRVVFYDMGVYGIYAKSLLNPDEAVERIIESNTRLKYNIEELNNKINGVKKDPTIQEFKQMSWWKFLEWKNKK